MEKLEKLITKLKKKKVSISIAESCSGGYASYLLTKIPGSSKVFKGGIIVYSLDIKNKFFKIPFPLLEKSKGVSEEVSIVLAKKVRKQFNADLGCSIVGFAGPKAKKGIKIGTVFICLADKYLVLSKKIVIRGSRDTVRKKASNILIDLLIERMSK